MSLGRARAQMVLECDVHDQPSADDHHQEQIHHAASIDIADVPLQQSIAGVDEANRAEGHHQQITQTVLQQRVPPLHGERAAIEEAPGDLDVQRRERRDE